MLKIAIVFAVVITMSGCASSLTTFDSNGKKSKGIPIAKPVLVKIVSEKKYQKVSKETNGAIVFYGNDCPSVTNSEYKMLPLGEVYYVGFKPNMFGKGEFNVEFMDSGGLKIISLNSEASAGIDAVKGILETMLPFVADLKTDKAVAVHGIEQQGAATVNSNGKKNDVPIVHCLKMGSEVKSIQRAQIRKCC